MAPTLSGQKTVTTAGAAEKLHADLDIDGPVTIKALTTNTGLVYIGNVDGDVASDNGVPLAAGDIWIFERVGNLADIWVDAAVSGEGVAWSKQRV